MSITSLDAEYPKTPQEYIDMIIDRHNKTRLQRFGNWINNEKCRNPCDKAIRAVKYTNKLGNQTRPVIMLFDFPTKLKLSCQKDLRLPRTSSWMRSHPFKNC
ncbi:hypothetical protein J4E91_002278 [Alternaria rosae]|nr:hypothetical protein J4E91_002278 [Alternaria rosae]